MRCGVESQSAGSDGLSQLGGLARAAVFDDQLFNALASELLVGVGELDAINAAVGTEVEIDFVGNLGGSGFGDFPSEADVCDVEVGIIGELQTSVLSHEESVVRC